MKLFSYLLLSCLYVYANKLCPDGWTGNQCSMPDCGHGVVQFKQGNQHECLCKFGWRGRFCRQPICQHGKLGRHKKCLCDAGYSGILCEIALLCSHGRLSIGKEPTCECFDGWTGYACDQIVCEHGVSNSSTECICEPGYLPPHCINPAPFWTNAYFYMALALFCTLSYCCCAYSLKKWHKKMKKRIARHQSSTLIPLKVYSFDDPRVLAYS